MQGLELKKWIVENLKGDVTLNTLRGIYEWMTEDGAKPEAPKEAAPKAETTAKPKTAEKPKAEAPKEDAPALDYQKDVVGRIVAHVSKLTSAGMSPIAAKEKVQGAIKAAFGVGNAKEVPADKWPSLLYTVESVTADE